ncbi:MAG TPA: choice-of-anchor D domain-containing protein [Streptosporangiaceae bacterium]
MAGGAAALTGALPRLAVTPAHADEITASQDNLRTGWDSHEPGLSPATVSGPTFGPLFDTRLNGQIYGQPIIAGHVLIVATETNHVYGLNAATGAVQWSVYLGPAESASTLNCGDLAPSVGVTSTPVYDSRTGTIYLVAVVDDTPTPAPPHIYAYALSAQTGAIRTGWPVAIHGSPVNEPGAVFNPLTERQRASLLLVNGWVYAAFASYCDFQPYAGYVAGVNTATRTQTLWTDEAGLTDTQGGIWQSGGGLMSDGTGRIFLSTGNGVSPPASAGTSPPPELGDSVVRLNVAASGGMSAADYFSPANAPTLDATDADFGSGAPVGLPFGTSAYPHLLVQVGKDGRVFLLNRDNLGGRAQGSGGTDQIVTKAGPYQGDWGHPAAFGPDASPVTALASNDYLFYIGKGDQMRYLQFGANSSGAPALADVANTSTTFGYTSGSPVVTSNGNNPASGVVWAVEAASKSGAGATLMAFDAAPPSTCTAAAPCTMSPIWSAPIGTASEFTIPATDSGRVYVGTRTGDILAFGSPDALPLRGSPVNFGHVPVGKASKATVWVTAARAVTVTSATVSGRAGGSPFTAGGTRVDGHAARLPVTLKTGDTLAVPVTFTPAKAGGVTAAVALATGEANFPAVNVSITGQGTAPGLQATPAAVNFKKVADKTIVQRTVLITNASTRTETITSSRQPGGPFRAKLPVSGQILAAGQSVAVPVSFRPTTVRSSSSALTITTSGGRVLTVRLTGTGLTAVSRLTAGQASVSFGTVPVGTSATRTIVITNKGNLPAVITGTAGPSFPFGSQAQPAAGVPVTPKYTVRFPVTFTPASAGQVTGSFALHWRDAEGRHRLTVALAGTAVTAITGRSVPPPGGGWTLNGSAAMQGENLALTTAAAGQTGSAIYAMREQSSGLAVNFTASLGGNGGLTLCLLDPATATAASHGRGGSQRGFGGLAGAAVVLGTGQFAGDPAANFVGIASSTAGTNLHYLATTASVPSLTTGSHAIGVTVTGRTVAVSVDGTEVLSAVLAKNAIPASALIGFTGSTGDMAGTELVSAATVTAGGAALPAPGGGWSFNGSAALSGSATELTQVRPSQAGSVVYPVAVPTNGLKVTFTTQMYGGRGAAGLTFALLSPADSGPASLGRNGLADGFAGLDGVAVVLGTVWEGGTPNWVAICTSVTGDTALSVGPIAREIAPLRPGPDTVTIAVTQYSGTSILTVWVDGAQVLRQPAPTLTATALLAFTAATTTRTDVHLVRDGALLAAS